MDHQTQSLPASRLSRFGKWCGIAGAMLCGILILMIVATVIAGANVRPGDRDGAFGVLIRYVVFIPIAFVPVALVCFVGAIVSRQASLTHASRDARLGLVLSFVAPGVVVICYAVGYALLY